MIGETTPSPNLPTDPALAAAERQLAMLGELAEMGLVVSRAYAHAAVAASHAVEVILADEFWQPETGRARALAGAKDAAEAFQKVSRSLRLTLMLMLEMTTSETVRDLRAGVPTRSEKSPAVSRTIGFGEAAPASAEAVEGDSEGRSARSERPGGEGERLYDVERLDRLPRGAFREVADSLAADIGASIDWEAGAVSGPKLEAVAPPPDGLDPAEPRGSPGAAHREASLSP